MAQSAASTKRSPSVFHWRHNATESPVDYAKNDLLLGSSDPIFWFLVPLFCFISVGVCALLNYAASAIVHILYLPFNALMPLITQLIYTLDRRASSHAAPQPFATSSPRRRLITTSILLLLVSTLIPYQFAYLVAFIAQLVTCVRALYAVKAPRLSASSASASQHTSIDFYNYAHSIFLLMLWVLPINIPVLVVWVHNLAVHWLTPFSSHHNVLSIMPFILLVETLASGNMIPTALVNSNLTNSTTKTAKTTTQVLSSSLAHHMTSILLFGVAVWTALYGVSYAYTLHHAINGVAAWLVCVHLFAGDGAGVSLKSLGVVLDDGRGGGGGGWGENGERKKTP